MEIYIYIRVCVCVCVYIYISRWVWLTNKKLAQYKILSLSKKGVRLSDETRHQFLLRQLQQIELT
jgi:hypothetical protein